jgi:hypothetical protein
VITVVHAVEAGVWETEPRFSGSDKLFIGERKQMRRLISLQVVGLLAIGLFLSIPSFAQEVITPKAEVFGGFSISSIPGVSPTYDPTTGLPTSYSRKMFMGWQAAANLNLTRHLGIVGDFGGQYASIPGATVLGVTIPGFSMNTYQFLFGPQIAFRKPRVTPYIHALFGGIKEGVGSLSVTDPVTGLTVTTPAVSSTGLGMGFGGGMDINISDRLALRIPQFDWTLRHIGSTTLLGVTVPGSWTTGQIRIGIGLVVKAGQK